MRKANMALSDGMLNIRWTMSMCAVDETGMNSVKPSTIPSKIA